MPDGTLCYPLHVADQQCHEFLEGDEVLVEPDYPYSHPPIALTVAIAAGMLVAQNDVANFTVHHGEDNTAHISHKGKGGVEEDERDVAAVAAPSLGVSNAMPQFVE